MGYSQEEKENKAIPKRHSWNN